MKKDGRVGDRESSSRQRRTIDLRTFGQRDTTFEVIKREYRMGLKHLAEYAPELLEAVRRRLVHRPG